MGNNKHSTPKTLCNLLLSANTNRRWKSNEGGTSWGVWRWKYLWYSIWSIICASSYVSNCFKQATSEMKILKRKENFTTKLTTRKNPIDKISFHLMTTCIMLETSLVTLTINFSFYIYRFAFIFLHFTARNDFAIAKQQQPQKSIAKAFASLATIEKYLQHTWCGNMWIFSRGYKFVFEL